MYRTRKCKIEVLMQYANPPGTATSEGFYNILQKAKLKK
jgi:hypothetical protein